MREKISCLRDRHGAGVSLLRPVQTLINPSQAPLPPFSLTLLEAKDCGGTVWLGAGFVLAGTPRLWVSSPTPHPLEDRQNFGTATQMSPSTVFFLFFFNFLIYE